MYTFKVRNERNEIYDITGGKYHRILSIDGLSPAAAEISTSDAVGYDGSIFTYGRCSSRNITIQLAMIGNIEESRQKLYRFFVPKKTVRLFFKNANRDVYIDGYVETMEINLFSELQTADISVICPMPYFIANQSNEYTLTAGSDNKLSVEIEGGEIESGCVFDIRLIDPSAIFHVIMENQTSGEKIEIDQRLTPFGFADIHINTYSGEKQAYFIDTDDNSKENLISSLKITGGWVKLMPGNNVINVYSSNLTSLSAAAMNVRLKTEKYYIGV